MFKQNERAKMIAHTYIWTGRRAKKAATIRIKRCPQESGPDGDTRERPYALVKFPDLKLNGK